ncbi:hypothetical protein SEA_CRICKO_8 [Streptomyces phage CricKo]|nr:hypothetical protein SEA_RAINYDAI_8 [Streptomyces phage Rainydai]QJD49891.1 hypothetical protein SEA_CRICKO_8 [Streptomyces phage CricKo]QNL30623.1 hypothetical protein SEA_THIQQUMS_8 [Streptomyces phage Thiqqums]
MTDRSPSPGELAHYGVKGMKWGVRKGQSGKQIRAARRRVASEHAKLEVQVDKVDDMKRGTAERARGEKQLEKATRDFLNNPDRVTAARTTKGEKIAAVLIAGPVGLTAVAATSVTTRVIDYKQRSGAYNR